MPEPKMELALKYQTSTQTRKRLRLSRWQFDRRIELGIFPRPTYVDIVMRGDVKLQVRYFDEGWIGIAKAIMQEEKKPEAA